jgi:hypothetical protein
VTRAAPGDLVAGQAVGWWLTQAEVAEVLQLTTREVRALESRGLPSEGAGKALRYPLPHVSFWYTAFKLRERDGVVVTKLPVSVAFAEHLARAAREDALADGQLVERWRRTR